MEKPSATQKKCRLWGHVSGFSPDFGFGCGETSNKHAVKSETCCWILKGFVENIGKTPEENISALKLTMHEESSNIGARYLVEHNTKNIA